MAAWRDIYLRKMPAQSLVRWYSGTVPWWALSRQSVVRSKQQRQVYGAETNLHFRIAHHMCCLRRPAGRSFAPFRAAGTRGLARQLLLSFQSLFHRDSCSCPTWPDAHTAAHTRVSTHTMSVEQSIFHLGQSEKKWILQQAAHREAIV